MPVPGIFEPIARRLTSSMSPTSSVSSMEPDVMTNVWTRNVRRNRKSATAIRIDFVHSAAEFGLAERVSFLRARRPSADFLVLEASDSSACPRPSRFFAIYVGLPL